LTRRRLFLRTTERSRPRTNARLAHPPQLGEPVKASSGLSAARRDDSDFRLVMFTLNNQ
jgi:hypothetical protein